LSIEEDSLGVNWNSLSAWACTAKAATRVCCDWEIWGARIGHMTSRIGIKTRTGRAIRTVEPNCLFVWEEQIVARGICNGGVWLRSEEDIKFMDSWLEIQRSLCVPVTRSAPGCRVGLKSASTYHPLSGKPHKTPV
jgi:hypothetical protein